MKEWVGQNCSCGEDQETEQEPGKSEEDSSEEIEIGYFDGAEIIDN